MLVNDNYLKMIEDYLDLNGNYSILLAATHPNKHCIEYQCQDNINNDIFSLYVNLKNDKIYNNILCTEPYECISTMLEANDNDREFQQKILNFANKYYNDFEFDISYNSFNKEDDFELENS